MPRAHGQAMAIVVTLALTAFSHGLFSLIQMKWMLLVRPSANQIKKVAVAISKTVGINIFNILSANCCIGGLVAETSSIFSMM